MHLRTHMKALRPTHLSINVYFELSSFLALLAALCRHSSRRRSLFAFAVPSSCSSSSVVLVDSAPWWLTLVPLTFTCSGYLCSPLLLSIFALHIVLFTKDFATLLIQLSLFRLFSVCVCCRAEQRNHVHCFGIDGAIVSLMAMIRHWNWMESSGFTTKLRILTCKKYTTFWSVITDGSSSYTLKYWRTQNAMRTCSSEKL